MSEGIGRRAKGPGDIPAKGWRQVLKRVWKRIGDDNLSLIAAGVAFYALLAVFPALASLVSIYGLVLDPTDAVRQFDYFRSILPPESYDLIAEQLTAVASGSEDKQRLGLLAATLLSIWSATKGSRSLISALNVVYDEHEKRNFLMLNLFAFTFTLFFLVLGVAGLAVILIVPVILDFVGFSALTEILMKLIRWPLVASVALVTLAAVYRYGPSRRNARWQWISPGALLAVSLWVIASAAFSLYVAHFGKYNATYGSVGAVVVLLMWFWITAFVVVLGAEMNAELERQTAKDTTWHGDQAMGQRGAYVADHLPSDAMSTKSLAKDP